MPHSPHGVGEPFGRYLLLEFIGRGGMAEVYRAVAHGLGGFQRIFVIKRILRDKSASREFVEMFINEARISALLNHPNIVQIYDFGQIDGHYFLAMEYLRGKDLLSVMRQLRTRGQVMAPAVAASVAGQVANGLAYAHSLSQGGKALDIVHRDVSPSNVMLLRAGGVKLLDFGIAKAAMEIRNDVTTQVGLVKGKLSYVSPEQIRGAPIDARSDVFALGVVLWECLTGKRLFFDKSDYQTMKNVLERPIPPPSTQRPDIPAALDYIVVRALERDVERRYPNAKMMADELENFLQEERYSARAMIEALDDLFGQESAQAEALIPEGAFPQTGSPTVLDKGAIPSRLASVLTPPPSTSSEGGYTGVSSVHRLPSTLRRKRISWAAAASAAVVLGGAMAFVGSNRTPKPPLLPPQPEESVAAREPPRSIVMPPAPDLVEVMVDSDPRQAEVHDGTGKLLGVTPVTLNVLRQKTPMALVVRKRGFATSEHAIVPDRDVSALLTLRLADIPGEPARPAAKSAKTKRRHVAPVPRTRR